MKKTNLDDIGQGNPGAISAIVSLINLNVPIQLILEYCADNGLKGESLYIRFKSKGGNGMRTDIQEWMKSK